MEWSRRKLRLLMLTRVSQLRARKNQSSGAKFSNFVLKNVLITNFKFLKEDCSLVSPFQALPLEVLSMAWQGAVNKLQSFMNLIMRHFCFKHILPLAQHIIIFDTLNMHQG
jgi:hypothetical protein